ncbi:MAG: RNA-guided endonuclease IscB [Candidatus Caldatribacteriota bacterium]
MRVYVKNLRGEALMPTTPKKARKLLKENKAKIISYEPFIIQLLYATGETKQPVSIGIDLGTKHIGLAIQSENKVIAKGEIELRDDVKSLIETRKIYRRSRRSRKTRYRKPRFDNRKRPDNWLPPSIQSRLDNTFMWIDKYMELLPDPTLTIEVGKFDVQKMINPDIESKGYQEGNTYGYYDTRYYVFARDSYTCQVCKKKGKILQTHHIIYKSKGGTDRANNLITVCTDCHNHKNHQEGEIFYKWMADKKKMPSYKETPFMNIIRKRVFEKYPNANITYGSITTPKRKELGLDKTHYNDALVISGVEEGFIDNVGIFKIKQFRKKKRSLHEATARKGRKESNTTQKRNSKNTKYSNGFYLNDKVRIFDEIGFISGFCSGGCYVKDIEDNYITIPEKTYKQVSFRYLEFIRHNNDWQFISHL